MKRLFPVTMTAAAYCDVTFDDFVIDWYVSVKTGLNMSEECVNKRPISVQTECNLLPTSLVIVISRDVLKQFTVDFSVFFYYDSCT